MKWLKQIGLQLGVTVVALALLFTIGAPVLQNLAGQSQVAQKALVTIGFAGEAYAVTPDYQVDGVADDVQVQQAMNALPTTGGRLVLFAGNYVFSATVSRAINNITIEGDGKGTYIAYNAANAVFSVGAQTGWVFKDFRTDAGWLTLATDTRLMGVLWKGTELVSNVMASGSTLPASPVVGQQFLHTPTGRTISYTYNGSAWNPDAAFGTVTVYVDPTGTDGLNYGWTTGASAFKTINYAYNMLPDILDDPATIHLSANTFVENLLWGIKAGKVTVQGAAMSATPLVATGGRKGAGASCANVSGAFVAGAHDGKLLEFTSGTNNGTKRIVGETVAAGLLLVGDTLPAQPQNLDAYNVLNWTSTINGWIDVRADGTGGQTPTGKAGGVVEFDYVAIDFVGSAPAASIYNGRGLLYLYCCSVIDAGDNVYGIYADVGAYTGVLYSNIELGANTQAAESDICSTIEIICSRIDGNEAAGTTGVLAHDQSSAVVWSSDIIHCTVGVYSWGDGDLWFVAPSVVSFVHGIVSYGARATAHSAIHYSGVAYVTFGTNMAGAAHATGGQSADAASYSYLGTVD